MKFLRNKSPEEFFLSFWEKEVLHIPNAIEIPSHSIDENDLLEMATDKYFETRLIQEDSKSNSDEDIKVIDGPLKIKKFSDLKGQWTLMIHNLNLYNEFALKLEKTVEFIPKWLFDDVMCSFSSSGSKIKAHIDKYNVFILQIKGSRKWLIEKNPKTNYKPNCELRVLETFKPDVEYILNPGDMVYIPPQMAHEGHSLDDSISLSIGFKSIEDKDLIENFLIHFLENFETEEFYKTHLKQSATKNPYEIDPIVVDQLFTKISDQVNDKSFFRSWLNNFLAQPKKRPDITNDKVSKDIFLNHLKSSIFCFDEFIRMSTVELKDSVLVNINELSFDLSEAEYLELRELIKDKHLEHSLKSDSNIEHVLFTLYEHNLIILINN